MQRPAVNSRPGKSETGLRGLTAIPNPSGTGEVLLAGVEGDASRVLRVDPVTGSEVTELDVIRMLSDVDPVDRPLAVPRRRQCGIFCRLRCQRCARARHRVDRARQNA
jgi:hypothetical protein